MNTDIDRSTGVHRIRNWMLAIALAVATIALLTWYARLPWDWSFIDDGTAVQRLAAAEARHGPVLGIADAVYGTFRFDLSWGLFRPSYWVFGGTFYAVGVRAAHALRLAMLLAAVVGPAAVAARRATGRRRVAMAGLMSAVLLANPALYSGLWYPSLQELSALAFIGLGLLPTRRQWPRIALFLVAAWFKSPFAWLLVSYGVLLWVRHGSRRAAAVSTLLGATTLAAASAFATHGTYAANMKLTATQIGNNIGTVPGLLGPSLVVVTAGLLLYGARVRAVWPLAGAGSTAHTAAAEAAGPAGSTAHTAAAEAAGPAGTIEPAGTAGTPAAPGPGAPAGQGADSVLPLALLTAGLAYLVNMLPWDLGVGGYYSAAWIYLVTAGIVLMMLDGPQPGRVLLVVSLVAAAGWLTVTDTPVVRRGMAIVANVNGLRDCVMRLPEGSAIGYNRGEAWIRLEQIVQAHDPDWNSRMYLVFPGAGTGWRDGRGTYPLTYYIEQHGYPPGAATLRGTVVCRTAQSTVYQVPGSHTPQPASG